MKRSVQVGRDYLLPDLGLVHVIEVLPHGGAIVLDGRGDKWIVGADMMEQAEETLFT